MNPDPKSRSMQPPPDRGRRIRVLFVSPLPPPAGGVATWTKAIVERGLPEPFEIELVNTRVTRRHWAEPTRLSFGEIRRTRKILAAFRAHIRSGRIDVVHINASMSTVGVFRNWVIARVAGRAGVPYVVQLRGYFAVPGGSVLGALQRRAYRSIFRNASAVLPLTGESRDNAIRLEADPDEIRMVPNFIEVSEIPKRRRTAGDGRLRAVYLGALSEDKGTMTILDIARKTDRIAFRLIGGGSDTFERQVRQRITRDRLGDRVDLAGVLPTEQARAALAEADVYLFPSATEGFPMSVTEAMAAGLPVIASPVGAIPEMIAVPDGGELVPHHDVDGYVDALTRLRDNPEVAEEMGKYNLAKATRAYDYPVVIRQLCDVYRDVVRRD